MRLHRRQSARGPASHGVLGIGDSLCDGV